MLLPEAKSVDENPGDELSVAVWIVTLSYPPYAVERFMRMFGSKVIDRSFNVWAVSSVVKLPVSAGLTVVPRIVPATDTESTTLPAVMAYDTGAADAGEEPDRPPTINAATKASAFGEKTSRVRALDLRRPTALKKMESEFGRSVR